MSEATTNVEPNLFQLGQEIGGNPGFRLSRDGDAWVVTTKDVEQATLAAALLEHDPDPSIVPPPTAADLEAAALSEKGQNVERDIATLRQWSLDAKAVGAQGANVTQAQHKALFDRMGTFLDRFADYVEAHR